MGIIETCPVCGNDLIDRNTLVDAIEGTDWYHVDGQGNLVHGARSDNTPLYKADDIYNIIENAKAVDAVEVVRCKKCIYFEPYTRYFLALRLKKENATEKSYNRGYCTYWEREALAEDTTVFDHDFCSRGKRKD